VTSTVMFQRSAVVDVSDETAAAAVDRRSAMKKAKLFADSGVSRVSSVSSLTTLLPMLCLVSTVEMQPLVSKLNACYHGQV